MIHALIRAAAEFKFALERNLHGPCPDVTIELGHNEFATLVTNPDVLRFVVRDGIGADYVMLAGFKFIRKVKS